MVALYVIYDTETDIWDTAYSSWDDALAVVVARINQMNKSFQATTLFKPDDVEYTPGHMEQDVFLEDAKTSRGALVADYSDYTVEFFIKEVQLST
jgi:hypothetical protein